MSNGFGDHHPERDAVAVDALKDADRHLNQLSRSHELWVIGDTPKDIQCAHAIGAKTIAVTTGVYDHTMLASHKPEAVVSDLVDARDFLASRL